MEEQSKRKNYSNGITLRVKGEDRESLELMALNEGVTISQLMRGAITALQVNVDFRRSAIIYGRDKGGCNVRFK